MCHVGISNEGRSSSMAIGLSNDCKKVFNEVPLTPWCHVIVHGGNEVKMTYFSTWFKKTIRTQLAVGLNYVTQLSSSPCEGGWGGGKGAQH